MSHLVRILRFVMKVSRDIPRVRLTIVLVVIAGLISGIANTGLIVLINQAVSGAGLTGTRLGVAFAGLCLGLPLFRFISQTLLVGLTQKTLYHLRMRWCRRIITLPLRTLEQVGPARLLASLTNDLGAITDALLAVPLLVMHAGVVAAALVYLGWLSGTLLLALLGFLVVGGVTYQLPLLWAVGYQRRARVEWDVLFEHIRSVTEGAKELKMHRPRRQALIDRRLDPSANALQRHITAASAIFNAASSWGQILFFVAIGLLLFVYPRFQAVPQEVLIGYSITLIAMMTPLELLLTSLPRLTNASVAIRRIDELGLSLWSESAERDAADAPGSPASGWKRIELAGVTHSYRGEVETETFTLGPLDLTIEPGELIFVVGGNGSGKTTLAKLLLGLYEPEGGEVRLDGERVTAENRDRYRQQFSAVFSDFFLFNSLLGLESSRLDEDARRYLERLRLDRKVRIEGGDLSTTDLSQGQRKRLALLTAYLEDRSIYLFDEWAADQDPMFKEVFYLQILPELKARGKTVVVISHDDRYYHVADRVLKLVYGQVESDLRPAAALAAGA